LARVLVSFWLEEVPGSAARAAIAAQQHRGKPRAMTTISAGVSLSTIQGHVHARPAPASPWDAPDAETPKAGVVARSSAQPGAGRKFDCSFAGDLPAAGAQFLADSQVPWGRRRPGRRGRPAGLAGQAGWYLVTTEDRMIPPAAQRAMADRAGASVSEIAASHAVCVSQPQVVADLLKQAAAAAGG
jgi:hypothetical protein